MSEVAVLETATGIEDLANAFNLPEVIDEPELRELYLTLIRRMQAESAHLPMTTVQHLLIERIAFNYVVMRFYELRDLFANSKAQREFNHFWLEMTREFNKQLNSGDAEMRAVVIQRVFGVIAGALEQEEPGVASRLRRRFSDALEAHGL